MIRLYFPSPWILHLWGYKKNLSYLFFSFREVNPIIVLSIQLSASRWRITFERNCQSFSAASTIMALFLTLIRKSWKTYPEIFPKFQFSGLWARPFYWETHPSKFQKDLIWPIKCRVFAVSNHSVFGHRRDSDSFCTAATNVSNVVTAKLFIKPSGNHSNPSNWTRVETHGRAKRIKGLHHVAYMCGNMVVGKTKSWNL